MTLLLKTSYNTSILKMTKQVNNLTTTSLPSLMDFCFEKASSMSQIFLQDLISCSPCMTPPLLVILVLPKQQNWLLETTGGHNSGPLFKTMSNPVTSVHRQKHLTINLLAHSYLFLSQIVNGNQSLWILSTIYPH